ncbi:MAG TPA: ATP-binding protein [Ktedonobacteraceae bacterium]|nr:ATP-binding protein [Ktedonobacteraceae bacterium]
MDRLSKSAEHKGVDNTLAGGGEMGRLMRKHDWAATPLGPIEQWPQSLRTAVSICLASRFPIIIFWGNELRQFYNDAYRPMLGITKHPYALGQRAEECWPEIWDEIGPMLHTVLTMGEATWSENLLLLLDRNGYVEECYFTFSYSPIRDETGEVGGVFCAVTETTKEVLGERRLRTLRVLAADTAEADSPEEVCRIAADILADDPADLPFTLLYLFAAEGNCAHLAATTGIASGTLATPMTLALDDPKAAWPLAQVTETGLVAQIDELAARFGDISGPLHDAERLTPQTALILPIARAGQDRPYGFLIAGISPRRLLDEDYRGFLQLLAGQIATACASARAYQEAQERAEALAELDRAKTAFFSNISHEFRTPLTLLLGPLDTVLSDPKHSLDPTYRERLEMVRRNGLRQLKLVNMLLDFSRIEAGRAEAIYEPTDLASLTADLTSTFRSVVESAGLRLIVDCPPLPELFYVDRDMWEKIVLNLLSNAFKFTFAGEIRVQLHLVDEHVELTVADTGVGIAETEQPHLFERFYRVRGVRARTGEGSGIGLSLVQELVRLHGGTIAVSSKIGQGTTFTVRLPGGRAHLPAERIETTRTLTSAAVGSAPYVEEALRWLPETVRVPTAMGVEEHLLQDLPRAKALARNGLSSARLLIVDDNADMCDYLTHLLSPFYILQTVADGATALSLARSWSPDLILADVMMPGLDGFALLTALRADARTSAVPVILLSARAGEEATIEGLRAGANDYLVKPFSARELLARVEAQLEIARLHQQLVDYAREAEEARQHLHDLFMQAPAIICVLRGPLHVYELANPLYLQVVGHRDIIGKPIREALPELEGQGFYELLDQVYTTGEPFIGNETLVLLDRDGDGRLEEVYFNFVYQPSRNAQGEVDGVLVHAVEVTEQVRARQQVEKLLRRQETILETLPDSLVIYDASGAPVQFNRVARSRTSVEEQQLSLADLAGRLDLRTSSGTAVPLEELPLARALRGETVVDEELSYRRLEEQEEHVVSLSAAPLRGLRAEIEGAVVITRDITERRQRMQRTQEALETLLAMAEMLVDTPDSAHEEGIVRHGVCHALLELTCTLLGCQTTNVVTVEPETLQLHPIARVGGHPEVQQAWWEQIPSVGLGEYLQPESIAQLVAGEALLLDITHSASPEVPTYGLHEFLVAPLRIGEQFLGVLTTDYSGAQHKYTLEEEKALLRAIGKLFALAVEHERLLAEQTEAQAREATLRADHQRMVKLIELAHDAVIVRDPKSVIQFWNHGAEHLYGWTEQEAIGQVSHTLLSTHFSTAREEVDAVLAETGEWEGILTHRRRDGEEVIVESRQVLVRDVQGELSAVLEINRDITARERLQQERTEALARELAAREASRRTDEFIGITSHELKTPLTTIKGNLQLARRRIRTVLREVSSESERLLRLLEEVQTMLDRAERQVDIQNRLVRDLVDTSRIQADRLELHREPTDLVTIVRNAVEDQHFAAPARTISFQTSLLEVSVLADAERIGQVVTNYLSNALKYSPEDSPVSVRVSVDEREARVEVIDKGPGLSTEQQTRIWERFYRVPEIRVQSGSGVGLGLGLHICRMLIEQHGGHVGVKSTPGKGSTFWFTLPLGKN